MFLVILLLSKTGLTIKVQVSIGYWPRDVYFFPLKYPFQQANYSASNDLNKDHKKFFAKILRILGDPCKDPELPFNIVEDI